MSLVPYLVNELLNDPIYGGYGTINRIYNQNFDNILLHDDLFTNYPLLLRYLNYFPRRGIEDSGTTIINEQNQFKVNLDVQQFRPNELDVKVVDDYLVIEGKHEEKQDKHGYISRQFTRRYKLPDTVLKENISSSVSSDGILSINAPEKVEAVQNSHERVIPIIHTHQPALKQSASAPQSKQS